MFYSIKTEEIIVTDAKMKPFRKNTLFLASGKMTDTVSASHKKTHELLSLRFYIAG